MTEAIQVSTPAVDTETRARLPVSNGSQHKLGQLRHCRCFVRFLVIRQVSYIMVQKSLIQPSVYSSLISSEGEASHLFTGVALRQWIVIGPT